MNRIDRTDDADHAPNDDSDTDTRAGLMTSLTTEAGDPRYAHIDELPIASLADLMNDADATVPAAVRRALPSIVSAIDAIAARMKGGGRLLYVGAGTSGRLGVLDASECPPTFGTPPSLVRGIIAGGPSAIVTPVEGAEDDQVAGAAAIDDAVVTAADAVVGIASSGRTPYVIGAIRRAAELGALTVGLSCNAGAPLGAAAEMSIEVPVGPEIVAGSTRLKAGTAQKLVLNMISTIVMVRLGKTYGNLMVDLVPTNEKLRRRAIRIVGEIAEVSASESRAALDATAFDIKAAVLVAALGLSPQDATARLARNGGHLRRAMEEQR
jgi:N-acetylmuramic acid 6-phosphate etherase